ncbi:site-specific integrase [Plantactinospora sp. BC1]|uniref:tyrosine-type recombinase/integrase n=1 Tax=Plantactinospora sp. BC1 TaxID=2108470 RepID=UPI001F2AD6CC|nr:site-specific integrase [Plantactinospora sp. BC1]
MADTDVIVRDPVSGLFGFRVEMGRDRNGARMQARRTGFDTEKTAMVEYRRLSRQRDAQIARPRLTDTVQSLCQSWLRAREQELQPNTVYNYTWLLSLIYPYLGNVRISRLSARMTERTYHDLEAAGYSRTTLRTLDLTLARQSASRPAGPWAHADHAKATIYGPSGPSPKLVASSNTSSVTGSTRSGGCCSSPDCDVASCAACSGAIWSRTWPLSKSAGNAWSKIPPAGCATSPPNPHNSTRTLLLDPATLKTLTDAKTATRTTAGSRYMFTGRTGQPLRPDNVTNRFNQLANRAGVRPIGPHQIRHLLASTYLDAGYGIHEVAERLGHDPATLMRYYTRVNATRRRQATNHIAQLLAESPQSPVIRVPGRPPVR